MCVNAAAASGLGERDRGVLNGVPVRRGGAAAVRGLDGGGRARAGRRRVAFDVRVGLRLRLEVAPAPTARQRRRLARAAVRRRDGRGHHLLLGRTWRAALLRRWCAQREWLRLDVQDGRVRSRILSNVLCICR